MQIIEPVIKDIGDLVVRRVLPSANRRAVGPFVFFDHFGPAEFPPGEGIQVRPHPHIGLATVTYLYEGEIIHRDSLGKHQPIRPGAVNLMTAGRGIVHSERAGEDIDRQVTMHGLQIWLALPDGDEECEPDFVHHPADTIPTVEDEGVKVNVVMGGFRGVESPVKHRVRTLYLDIRLAADRELQVPGDVAEIAAYVISGHLDLEDARLEPGQMGVIAPGTNIGSTTDSHFVLVGGDSVGRRHVWWNFVSSSKERIQQAADQWRRGGFPLVPGDEKEFIPLPD